MRERRTTVRINCVLPAQSHPLDTALESPGRVTDMSIEGLRLVAGAPLQEGQRVEVGFDVPDHDQRLNVRGVVRWAGPAAGEDGQPAGLEFEQLDQTTRFRLQSFIAQQTQDQVRRIGSGQAAWIRARKSPLMRALSIGWPLLLGLIAASGCLWILSLQREQERLRQALADQTASVAQLETQHRQLQQELDQTRVTASLTGLEAQQLQSQREEFANEVARLATNLSALDQDYAKLQAERDALKQWIQALEQQQRVLEQRLSSIPELRKALRDAYVRQRQQQRAQWMQWVASFRKPVSNDHPTEAGNHGYLVRNGQATSGPVPSASLSIRVHDLESSSAP